MPYQGGTGLGKPLKLIQHPVRPDIPLYLGAEGPKNVALGAELCDGWIPMFLSPYRMMDVYKDSLSRRAPDFDRQRLRRRPVHRSAVAMSWRVSFTRIGAAWRNVSWNSMVSMHMLRPASYGNPFELARAVGGQRILWLEFDRRPMAEPCHRTVWQQAIAGPLIVPG